MQGFEMSSRLQLALSGQPDFQVEVDAGFLRVATM